MELSKENLRVLPLAALGLACAVVDICVIQEIKRFRSNYEFFRQVTRAPEAWETAFFGDNDGTMGA